jgi:hypothetical protein
VCRSVLSDKQLNHKNLRIETQLPLEYQNERGTNKYMNEKHVISTQKTSSVNNVAKKFIQRPLGEYFEKDEECFI